MSGCVFTCITCRVAFADADIQRAHYKTDWHRYNLKRKVAELPPVTAESFAEKVKAQRAQVAAQETDSSGHCDICNKHFSSKNAYENHLKSKKHKDTEAKQQQKIQIEQAKLQEKQAEKEGSEIIQPPPSTKVVEKNMKNTAIKQAIVSESPAASTSTTEQPMEDEDDDDEDETWEGDALGLEECLFCSHISRSMVKNVEHMTKFHSFFIPDLEFLTDLEGLVIYLGEKVGEGHVCLWCNEKGKSYLTTKSVQQHMTDKGHCKMLFEGDAVYEYSDFYDYRKSYPDYVEGQEKMEVEEEEEELDEEVVQETQGEDFYQLVLPSGCTLGHRSLQRYYRQKLRPDRSIKLTPVNKLMSQYRALGWTGSSGPVHQKRAKDMAYLHRQKQRHYMRLGCKAHKLVNHFRMQVIF